MFSPFTSTFQHLSFSQPCILKSPGMLWCSVRVEFSGVSKGRSAYIFRVVQGYEEYNASKCRTSFVPTTSVSVRKKLFFYIYILQLFHFINYTNSFQYFNWTLHVCYTFRPFLRPSSGMSIQKSSKGPLKFYLSVYSFRWFLYCHAWWDRAETCSRHLKAQ